MLKNEQLEEIISKGESLNTEFKSDRRKFSDKEIFEEVVALANTEGGLLLIGIEDNGTVTGAQNRHGTTINVSKLRSAIFNNTVPTINTQITVFEHSSGSKVLVIAVDPYPEPCATASGKSLKRTLGPDGKPQSVPFYPRDQRSRRVDLGLLDFSAQVIEGVQFEDLDPQCDIAPGLFSDRSDLYSVVPGTFAYCKPRRFACWC